MGDIVTLLIGAAMQSLSQSVISSRLVSSHLSIWKDILLLTTATAAAAAAAADTANTTVAAAAAAAAAVKKFVRPFRSMIEACGPKPT